ncbi:DUF4388 domain-containing protein [Oceanithermus sp.]
MAIFGDLRQISLGDLLPLLKSQKGCLEIFNLDGLPRVTLCVDSGRLVSLELGGKHVDEVQVHSVMNELMNAKRGSFEFIPGVSPRVRRRPGWSLDRLMLSVVTVADEIQAAEKDLPHPDTVFKLVSQEGPEDSRVADFWAQARRMLAEGASSRQISQRLGVPLSHAGFYLLRLRQAGLIEPVRAASRPARASVVGRLLGSLKRRFFGASALGAR